MQNNYNQIISTSVLFIKAITEEFGAEKGMELWDRISEVIDPEIKGQIFFSMLTMQYGTIFLQSNNLDQIQIQVNKIPIIKCLRNYTGMGLKEAKDCVDNLLLGKTQKIEVQPENTVKAMTELRILGLQI